MDEEASKEWLRGDRGETLGDEFLALMGTSKGMPKREAGLCGAGAAADRAEDELMVVVVAGGGGGVDEW